jgi:hypothetical protein
VITAEQKVLIRILVNRHMDINTMHFMEANGVSETELDHAFHSFPKLKDSYFRLMPIILFSDMAGYTRPILNATDVKNIQILSNPKDYFRVLSKLGQTRLSLGFYGQAFEPVNFAALLHLPASDPIPADSTLKTLPASEREFLRNEFLPNLFIQGNGLMLIRQIHSQSPQDADKFIYLLSCLHQNTGNNSFCFQFPGLVEDVLPDVLAGLQTSSLAEIREAVGKPDSLPVLEKKLGLRIFSDQTLKLNVVRINGPAKVLGLDGQPAALSKHVSPFNLVHNALAFGISCALALYVQDGLGYAFWLTAGIYLAHELAGFRVQRVSESYVESDSNLLTKVKSYFNDDVAVEFKTTAEMKAIYLESLRAGAERGQETGLASGSQRIS